MLGALGELATRVRSSLGESLAGLSAQVKPLPVVTTSSLEALKLYADSLKLDARGTSAPATRCCARRLHSTRTSLWRTRSWAVDITWRARRAAREEAEQLFLPKHSS